MTDASLRGRWDLDALRTYLNRLDRAGQGRVGPELRCWERFPYRRRDLEVDLLDDDDQVQAVHSTLGRNLSRGGVGFLNHRMIYPRARCRVQLRGPHGHREEVVGRVVHCRYVLGSGSLYDVGLQFDRLIDVTTFEPQARLLRILLVDEDPLIGRLLANFLSGTNVHLISGPPEPKAVVQKANADPFDLLLLDLESPRLEALEVTRQLRGLGFVGSIVGMAVEVHDRLYAQCLAVGCTGYLRKPITRGLVRRLVRTLMHKPLVSTLAHDPRMTALIDRFVGGLPARAKNLAFALKLTDLERINQLAHDLRGEAGSYGFAPLTAAAADVQLLIAGGEPLGRIRYALDHLIHLCRSARPATCGDVVTADEETL